jgi:hypothetical protein
MAQPRIVSLEARVSIMVVSCHDGLMRRQSQLSKAAGFDCAPAAMRCAPGAPCSEVRGGFRHFKQARGK